MRSRTRAAGAALDGGFVKGLRAETRGGWALGDTRFRRQIAKALGRQVAPLPRGLVAGRSRHSAT